MRILIILLLLCGCSAKVENDTSGAVKEYWSQTYENGQSITMIDYGNLSRWMRAQKGIRVVSLCPLGGGSGTRWVTILYEKVEDQKHACPVCGQQMPAEKKP